MLCSLLLELLVQRGTRGGETVRDVTIGPGSGVIANLRAYRLLRIACVRIDIIDDPVEDAIAHFVEELPCALIIDG